MGDVVDGVDLMNLESDNVFANTMHLRYSKFISKVKGHNFQASGNRRQVILPLTKSKQEKKLLAIFAPLR